MVEKKRLPPLGEKRDYLTFTGILNENKIRYCMDSGVLLALMREGKMFDREKDVDIQMWIEEEEKLYDLLPVFRAAGFIITVWLYKGLVYQYRFSRHKKIPIHVMFFRRYGDRAWCPAGKSKGSPFSFYLGKKAYGLFVLLRRYLRDSLMVTDVDRWPWKVRRELATWWIPAGFFEEAVFHEGFQVYIPRDWPEYLQFRYGQWEKPAEKWNFWHNDGAIVHKCPEALVEWSKYKPFSLKEK